MKLYYNTSEVADMLDINASKVRFYEKEFKLNFERSGRDRRITLKDVERLKKIIEEKEKGSLTLRGTHRKLNNKTDVNKNKNALKAKLLTIKAFLIETLDELD